MKPVLTAVKADDYCTGYLLLCRNGGERRRTDGKLNRRVDLFESRRSHVGIPPVWSC